MSYSEKILNQQWNQRIQTESFKQFRDSKFWIWDIEKHKQEYSKSKGKCCYNHLVDLPRKQDKTHPLYDYQLRTISALEQHRLIAVFKARAVGITELMLRYMEWLCLRDNAMRNKNMIIISAPAEDLSISFIRRMRAHLETAHIQIPETREKVLLLNGCRIEALPSHNLRRLRGLTDVSFLLAEESDHWNRNEEDELLPTIMPLTQKDSMMMMALVSTPGRLGGLMQRLSQTPEDKSRFKKIYIPYTDVVGKLFTREEIALAKLQPSFEREFDLAWGYGMGNIFNPADLQKATDLGARYADVKSNSDCVRRPYPFSIYPEGSPIIGVDPGAAGSMFAIVLLQLWDSHVHVHTALQYHRPHEDDMIDIIMKLLECTYHRSNVYVDAANQSFIRKLKSMVKRSEQIDVDWQLDYLRRHNLAGMDDIDIPRYMCVVPVSFSKHGPRLLQTAATYIQRQWVAIHPQFTELIEAMQAAQTKENGTTDWALDKSSHSLDLLDAYRLCHYNLLVTPEVIAA